VTFTQSIPTERLSDLDLHEGDTLQVIALLDYAIIVNVSRADDGPPAAGKASEWLRSAKGSVQLAPGESVDDLRMDYYATKHGVNR